MKNLEKNDPPGLKGWLRIFYILCALLLLADFIPLLIRADDGSAAWETSWGFYGIYGFSACVILVIAAKGLRKFVMRSENFYEK